MLADISLHYAWLPGNPYLDARNPSLNTREPSLSKSGIPALFWPIIPSAAVDPPPRLRRWRTSEGCSGGWIMTGTAWLGARTSRYTSSLLHILHTAASRNNVYLLIPRKRWLAVRKGIGRLNGGGGHHERMRTCQRVGHPQKHFGLLPPTPYSLRLLYDIKNESRLLCTV